MISSNAACYAYECMPGEDAPVNRGCGIRWLDAIRGSADALPTFSAGFRRADCGHAQVCPA